MTDQLALTFDGAPATLVALATPDLATFDRTGEDAAKREAITRVVAHADQDWIEEAREAVHQTALTHAEFISDDIWRTGLAKPREARALGGVTTWAAKQGWIVKTDRMRPSDQVGCHRMPRSVWRSQIFEPSAPPTREERAQA